MSNSAAIRHSAFSQADGFAHVVWPAGRRDGRKSDRATQTGAHPLLAPILADMRKRVTRSLAWYGAENVSVGPFVGLGDGTLMAVLLDRRGSMLDRVRVDRASGALRPTREQADRLLAFAPSTGRQHGPIEPVATS